MNILSEIGEYIRSISELAKHAPPDKLAVMVMGSIALGGVSGWYAHRLARGGKPRPAGNVQDEPSSRTENLARLEAALDRNDEELWRFHKSKVPIDFLDRIVASGLKVITLANLKGGVGKTTLAANLAAYLERLGHRVLLIDFDYQGSLSITVRRAAERTHADSASHRILTQNLTAQEVAGNGFRLDPRLANLRLVPAGYEVSRQEARILMRWLLQQEKEDPRYALARLLSQPMITTEFQYVIIDTPPRLNLATVNALCASRYLIIPTILDVLSIENVGVLLGQTDAWFRKDLNPHLRLAGIVGSMTKQRDLNDTELSARKTVEETAREQWDKLDRATISRLVLDPWPEDAHVLQNYVPDTARFLHDAGRDIAYLDESKANRDTRATIDRLGQEILKRISR